MKPIRLLASSVTIATGIIGTLVGYTSPAPEGSQLLIKALGVVLVLLSLACFYGVRIAFAASAIVSVPFLFSAWVGWGGGYSTIELVSMGVAVVNIPVSVMAYRTASHLSEQANPMNLPVFG